MNALRLAENDALHAARDIQLAIQYGRPTGDAHRRLTAAQTRVVFHGAAHSEQAWAGFVRSFRRPQPIDRRMAA